MSGVALALLGLGLALIALAGVLAWLVAHQKSQAVRLNSFLDSAGHELRTPLTAILGYQELLEEGVYGTLDDRGAEAVRRIGSAGRELLSLLNGMVDMSRPERQPADLQPEPVDINGTVLDAVAAGTRLAPERNVEWKHDIEPDLPVLRSDAQRLQRALFLVVLACIRATPGGSLTLRARRTADSADGDGVVLEIEGVPFARLPRPPIDRALRESAADDERSLLRLLIAVDGIERLNGSVELNGGSPGVLRLLLRHVDAPKRAG